MTNQQDKSPEIIVVIMLFDRYPIIIDTMKPIIFGSLICTIAFDSFKKTAGNIIAGNTADGT